MKIIVLLNSLYTGGAEFSTLTFYGWLAKQGYFIKVICCKEASPHYDPAILGLSEVTILKEKGFWQKLRMMDSIIKEFNPDLIHSVLFDANMLGRFCRFKNPKLFHMESLVNEVYSVHRLRDPQVTRLKLKAYQWLDFFTQLWGVDHYHANGISVANHYREKLKIRNRRITVIPRGRRSNQYVNDDNTRGGVRKQFNIDNREMVLVSVGRHEYQKGHDTLLEALSILASANLKFICLIVGREGKYTPVLQQRIKRYSLHDKVILTGHRSDVPQILAAADIFVFPSRFEGLPGALIEAEAASLPIVCSDIPNNREVAVEDKNALFFPVDDVNSLSQQLKVLLTDGKRRRHFAEKSMLLFEDRFQLDGIHERMKNLIDSLVEKS